MATRSEFGPSCVADAFDDGYYTKKYRHAAKLIPTSGFGCGVGPRGPHLDAESSSRYRRVKLSEAWTSVYPRLHHPNSAAELDEQRLLDGLEGCGHLFMRDLAVEHARRHVGHHSYSRIGNAGLAGQRHLGVASHAHDAAAHLGVHADLRRCNAHPSRPFLVERGGLPELCRGLEPVSLDEDWFGNRHEARLVARRAG